MIRNLKALGLAFAAMLALGAVAASGASAQQGELTTEDGQDVTLIATENPEPAVNALTAFERNVVCPGSSYTGHKVLNHEQTTHIEETEQEGHDQELVSNKDTEVTITPHYNQAECEETTGGFSATVDMGTCDYVFELGETAEETENTYDLAAEVDCDTPGDEIHVSLYGNQHHESGRVCTVEVGEQTIEGAHATDNTDGTLTAEGTFTDIHVERHGLCVLDGKGTTTTKGEFHLDADVTAVNANEEATEITISHEG